ncbi:MBL fold metallo-hydrolase [bacterium]|nr:MBL fold metallo-hydrolase [bacterium]
MEERLMGATRFRNQISEFLNEAKFQKFNYNQLPTISTQRTSFPPVLATYLLKKENLLDNQSDYFNSMRYPLFLAGILLKIQEGRIVNGSELVDSVRNNFYTKEVEGKTENVLFDLSYGALQFYAFFEDEVYKDLFKVTLGLTRITLENIRKVYHIEHLNHFKTHAAVFLAAESDKQHWVELILKTNEILESWGESPANVSVITHSAHNLYISCQNMPDEDKAYNIVRKHREEHKNNKIDVSKTADELNSEIGWKDASHIVKILWPDFYKHYYRYNVGVVREISSYTNVDEAKKWAVKNKFVSESGAPYVKDSLDTEAQDWLLSFPGGYTIGNTSMLCKAGNTRLLFDYGCDNYGRMPVWSPDIDLVDAVLISHAHRDHIGGLLDLYIVDKYQGPWYATSKTADLARLIFDDHIKLLKRELGDGCPFSEVDIEYVMSKCVCVEIGDETQISGNLSITPYEAGHIIGSCQFLLTGKDTSILYTGDYNTQEIYSVEPMDKIEDEKRNKIMALITESTYAFREDTIINGLEARENLLDKIATAPSFPVLLPVLSLGRAQEILAALSGTEYSVGVFGLAARITEASGINYHNNIVFERKPVWKIRKDKYDILVASAGSLQGGPAKAFYERQDMKPLFIILTGYIFPGTPAKNIEEHIPKIRYSGHPSHKDWFEYINSFPNADKFVIHYPGARDEVKDSELIVPHIGKEYRVKKWTEVL